MHRRSDPLNPFFIDFPQRIRRIQAELGKRGLAAYVGSRLRTLSWTLDVFCPWRSFIVIPREGPPTAITFVIDASRVADEGWLDAEHVLGYAPMGGQDQIAVLTDVLKRCLPSRGKHTVGIETGMSCYLPEGNLTSYEHQQLTAALPDVRLENAHDIVDALALIKDEGTVARFREASRIVDVGHRAVYDALKNGGYRGMTETELAGLASWAMRRAGSEFEWSFTGGNEIASGHRTGLAGGACTPATRKTLVPGEPLMVDLHAMYRLGLGDHTHNYLLGPSTERQRWHASNFQGLVRHCLGAYRAGQTPTTIADEMQRFSEDGGFAEYVVPGFEHGIGLMGDEWRIGLNRGPFAYWTDPDHTYRPHELIICAIQYACPEEGIGFRYENPMLLREDGNEVLSKYPLAVEEL
jgi:Xaa-Pro aminopeptidase